MATKKFDTEELKAMRIGWSEPLASVLPKELYERFLSRKQAVDMYIDCYKCSEIEAVTGIPATRLVHLVELCISPGTDGNMAGYNGLVPERKRTEERNPNYGKEFTALLLKYPELSDFIKGNYFGERKYTECKNMSIRMLHGLFIAECKRLGVQLHEYPFNTENKGYVSLCSYVHSLENQNARLNAKRLDKDTTQKLASTGSGIRYSTNALVPFSNVQADGHIIDMLYTVEVEGEDGTVSRTIATRAWIIAVIDVATRCILGYSVSQEFNYNQYDVMDAIRDSIVPKKLMELSIPGLAYPENGGFYSLVLPKLEYSLFDTIMLDNAKSHLSEYTLSKLVDELICTVNYGSVATPETRGIVERFFETLETTGFHRLPMTTGSDSKDLIRKSPEKTAIKYDVTYDQMIQILDVLIAEYNNRPHSGIDNLTPLECMKQKVYEAGMMPCTAKDAEIKKIVDRLILRVDTRVIRGRSSRGKHPYVHFMGVEYRNHNHIFNDNHIGMKIQIVYNPRDITSFEAYTMDGRFLGILHARGEFGTKSHSVKTRQNAMKLARERARQHLEFDTPISAYMKHLKKEGKKNRRAATRADIVRREAGMPESPTAEQMNTDNIIPLEEKKSYENRLKYEDIKEMTPEELYSALFEEKKEG